MHRLTGANDIEGNDGTSHRLANGNRERKEADRGHRPGEHIARDASLPATADPKPQTKAPLSEMEAGDAKFTEPALVLPPAPRAPIR